MLVFPSRERQSAVRQYDIVRAVTPALPFPSHLRRRHGHTGMNTLSILSEPRYVSPEARFEVLRQG